MAHTSKTRPPKGLTIESRNSTPCQLHRTRALLSQLTSLLSASINGYFRNRHDEAAAPLPDELQLLYDFVFQVPWQDDNIVWFGLSDPVWMINRDVTAWQEAPLLVWAPVHRV